MIGGRLIKVGGREGRPGGPGGAPGSPLASPRIPLALNLLCPAVALATLPALHILPCSWILHFPDLLLKTESAMSCRNQDDVSPLLVQQGDSQQISPP